MRLLSRTIQNRFDAYLMNQGYPMALLMETAGLAVREHLHEQYPTRPHLRLFAGRGNNGGDVLVLARHLAADRWPFTLYMLNPLQEGEGLEPDHRETAIASDDKVPYLSPTAVSLQRKLLLAAGIQSYDFSAYEPRSGEVLVDGVLGSGFEASRGLPNELANLFITLNKARSLGSRVVSVDLPSGIDAETGHVTEQAVIADETVALEAPHVSILTEPGKIHAGMIIQKPLQISPSIAASFWASEDSAGHLGMFAMDTAMFRKFDRIPSEASHKGSQGRVLIFAGSDRYPGAALLAAGAALHSGAGYVELFAPPAVLKLALQRYPEIIVHDRMKEDFSTLDLTNPQTVVLLGPGMTDHDELTRCFNFFIQKAPKLILDAGIFDLLKTLPESTRFSSRPSEFSEPILTPHPGEFRRLFGNHAERLEAVLDGGHRAPCTLLLKGSGTLTYSARRNRLYVNRSGNRGLACAGSGDVLAGIMAALLAASDQDPVEVAAMAAFLHGRAADRLAEGTGPDGVTPSGLVQALGPALAELRTDLTALDPALAELRPAQNDLSATL